MNTAPSAKVDEEIEWDVRATLRKILRRKRTLFAGAVIGLLLALALALYIKPWYTAQAVFLPPKATDSASEAPVAAIFGSSNLSDSYLGMLASRTVADDVVDHLGLMQEFHVTKRVDARARLSGVSKFTVSKNSLIQVDITSGKPELAARIANAYLDALYRLNGHMVDSASDHRRDFFEAQLQQQKQALSEAEVDLKNTQVRTGLVLPVGEAQAGLNATAQLEAQIGGAETRLAGLMVSETEQNPEVIEARSQLNQLRAQLARQQSDAGRHGPASGIATNGRIPELTLEYVQKEREVRLQESVYNTLVQQYERARLSSIDPGPQLQVVDRAVEPERKSGPARTRIVLGGPVLGFFIALGYILLADPIRRFTQSLRDPAPAGTP